MLRCPNVAATSTPERSSTAVNARCVAQYPSRSTARQLAAFPEMRICWVDRAPRARTETRREPLPGRIDRSMPDQVLTLVASRGAPGTGRAYPDLRLPRVSLGPWSTIVPCRARIHRRRCRVPGAGRRAPRLRLDLAGRVARQRACVGHVSELQRKHRARRRRAGAGRRGNTTRRQGPEHPAARQRQPRRRVRRGA